MGLMLLRLNDEATMRRRWRADLVLVLVPLAAMAAMTSSSSRRTTTAEPPLPYGVEWALLVDLMMAAASDDRLSLMAVRACAPPLLLMATPLLAGGWGLLPVLTVASVIPSSSSSSWRLYLQMCAVALGLCAAQDDGLARVLLYAQAALRWSPAIGRVWLTPAAVGAWRAINGKEGGGGGWPPPINNHQHSRSGGTRSSSATRR
jgi:hypothetical protein